MFVVPLEIMNSEILLMSPFTAVNMPQLFFVHPVSVNYDLLKTNSSKYKITKHVTIVIWFTEPYS